MQSRWVYILEWTKYYVGSTNNIERRLKEHNAGKTITTSKLWKLKLVRWITCDDEVSARELEKKIKKTGHYERRIK